MSRIESLSDIKNIKVHWSESKYINDILGCDENSDIEKDVDVYAFDSIVKHASSRINGGYDKASMTIELKNGLQWALESKFHITSRTKGLLDLINAGQ